MKTFLFNNNSKQINDILGLFALSFKKPIPEKYWQWRYLDNPTLKNKFIHLMYDNEILVGHYAVSPVKMKYNDEIFLSGLSMTTMTHPEYGGKGIFKTLAKSVYEDMKASGLAMVWGFPNQNSHYGFQKNLDWQDVFQIPMLIRKVNNIKLVDSEVNSINDFTQDIADKYFNRENGVLKDESYLNWRYRDCPIFDYHVLEVLTEYGSVIVVFKSYNESNGICEVDIVELKGDVNSISIEASINAIFKHFESQDLKVTKLNTWTNLYNRMYQQFEKSGFNPSLPITYLGKRSLLNNQLMSDFSDWNVSLGDSDVY